MEPKAPIPSGFYDEYRCQNWIPSRAKVCNKLLLRGKFYGLAEVHCKCGCSSTLVGDQLSNVTSAMNELQNLAL